MWKHWQYMWILGFRILYKLTEISDFLFTKSANSDLTSETLLLQPTPCLDAIFTCFRFNRLFIRRLHRLHFPHVSSGLRSSYASVLSSAVCLCYRLELRLETCIIYNIIIRRTCSWAKNKREMVIGESRLWRREVGRRIVFKEGEMSETGLLNSYTVLWRYNPLFHDNFPISFLILYFIARHSASTWP